MHVKLEYQLRSGIRGRL